MHTTSWQGGWWFSSLASSCRRQRTCLFGLRRRQWIEAKSRRWSKWLFFSCFDPTTTCYLWTQTHLAACRDMSRCGSLRCILFQTAPLNFLSAFASCYVEEEAVDENWAKMRALNCFVSRLMTYRQMMSRWTSRHPMKKETGSHSLHHRRCQARDGPKSLSCLLCFQLLRYFLVFCNFLLFTTHTQSDALLLTLFFSLALRQLNTNNFELISSDELKNYPFGVTLLTRKKPNKFD